MHSALLAWEGVTPASWFPLRSPKPCWYILYLDRDGVPHILALSPTPAESDMSQYLMKSYIIVAGGYKSSNPLHNDTPANMVEVLDVYRTASGDLRPDVNDHW